MSARDEALDLIEKILPPEHAKAYRRVFSKKLDAYAHELAKQIRAHDGAEPDDYRKPQAWREGYSDGLQGAADLIDPESAP